MWPKVGGGFLFGTKEEGGGFCSGPKKKGGGGASGLGRTKTPPHPAIGAICTD